MGLGALILATLAITPSGALSPGPLSTATIAVGVRSGRGWRAGAKVAFGHMLVEIAYVAMLCLALNRVSVLLQGSLGKIMNAAAFAFIVYFALMLLRDSYKGVSVEVKNSNGCSKQPVLVGAALTGLNAFFLLWWVTVGFSIVKLASQLGVVGFIAMYSSHVWMDYAWLSMLAEAGCRSKKFIGSLGYRVLLASLALILLGFGFYIILRTF